MADAAPSPGADSPHVFTCAGGVPGERDCVCDPDLLAGGESSGGVIFRPATEGGFVDAQPACVAAGVVVPVASGFTLSQRIVILIREDGTVFTPGCFRGG